MIIIIILILNVSKVALNNFRGYITAKDCLKRPKIVTSYRAMWSIAGQCRWAETPWLRY